MKVVVGHIHLTADNRLEVFLLRSLDCRPGLGYSRRISGGLGFGKSTLSGLDRIFHLPVMLLAVVEKRLDTEHVAMIGHGKSRHTVGHSLLDKPGDSRQTIQQRIRSMYVKMYEI